MDKPGAIYAARPLTDPAADRVALATIFSALRTPQRVRTFQIVVEHGPIATSEIKGASKTQPNSWLEDLLAAGLVTRTRVRTHWVWSAQPDAFHRVAQILGCSCGMQSLTSREPDQEGE